MADRVRLAVWAFVGVALLAGGFAAAGLPLLEAPGFELALSAALLAAFAGAPLGIGTARRELARPAPSPPRAFFRAALLTLAVQGLFAAGAVTRSLLLSPCSSTQGLAFLPVLAVPSALLAAALGAFTGFAARGRRLAAGLLYAALALASLGAALWEAYRGPAAYVLADLFGAWPGPLYDEALSVDRRLLLFRLGSLALTLSLVGGAAILVARRAGRPALRPAAAALAGLALAALVRLAAASSGDIASRGAIDRALGGRREGTRCDLHYPAEWPPAEAERVWRGCEVDAAEVANALGIERPPRVTVWLYRSEAEKRRLVGAGRTDFTKPWLAEVELVDALGGPPTLRHELVHAVAGAAAPGPLHVPATFGVFVNVGLVEGLAVALDLPHGEWTVHEWAKAMRDLGLLPPAGRLVRPAGFFSAPPARAYAAAGSLLRFLLDRYGSAPVRRAYGGASFEAAFGRPLSELEAEWLLFLDGIPVPPELASAAEARFRPPGLLGLRCAREVAGLEVRAGEAEREGRPADAAAHWRRAAALSSDPADLAAAGEALRLSDPGGADRALAEALAAGKGRPALLALALGDRGDLAWIGGDEARAATFYRQALSEHPDRPGARLLEAKLAATSDRALGAAAGPYLLGLGDPGLALCRLAGSDRPLAAYLVGRAAFARGAFRLASDLLSRALGGSLPSSFRTEALRVLGEARCAAGDDELAASAFSELAATAGREADREVASALARRCAEQRRAFGAPPRSPSDWPR